MRKGRRKTGLRMRICLAGTMLLHTIAKTYSLTANRPIVNLSVVTDGTYDGTDETPFDYVTVMVTVQGHRISDIQLIHNANGL